MKKALLALTLLPALGCSFHARSPDEYRDATEALLQTKNADVKLCYDEALKTNKDLSGDVTVHFKVEAETGKVFDVTVVGVNLIKMPAKPKRRGMIKGVRPGWKKAIVELKAGDKIDIFEGAQL